MRAVRRMAGSLSVRRIAAPGERYNAKGAQGTMLKRPGKAEEVAAAILFSASDDGLLHHRRPAVRGRRHDGAVRNIQPAPTVQSRWCVSPPAMAGQEYISSSVRL
jgi:hypothetical protein